MTIRAGERQTERITNDQAARDQQTLVNAGMVIARSNPFQTELLCKRTGNRTVFTNADFLSPADQPA